MIFSGREGFLAQKIQRKFVCYVSWFGSNAEDMF